MTVDSFTNERRFARDLEALLPRIKLTVDDAIPNDFDTMHAVVTVMLRNGERHSKRVDRLSGWVGYPLTAQQRMKKFHACARRVIDAQSADRIVALVERLDELQDVTEIMDLVRGDERE